MTNDNAMNKINGSADFVNILTAGGKVNKYAFLFVMVAITVTIMMVASDMEYEVAIQLISHHMTGVAIYLHICSCIFIYRQFKENKGNIKSIGYFIKPYCEDYFKASMISGLAIFMLLIVMDTIVLVAWSKELDNGRDIIMDMFSVLYFFIGTVLFSVNFIQPKLLGWLELDFYEFGWPRPKNNS